MKLVDANLLVYAYDSTSPDHDRARRWLEDSLADTETVGFSWLVLLAFVRLVTNPQVFASPLTSDQAIDIVDTWLDHSVSTEVHPTSRHLPTLRDLLARTGTAGNLTNDAHLAALAIEHGATLYSADADFSRFPGVEWANPLRD